MLADRLQRRWRETARFLPVHPSMSLEPDGLVLGSGTILARAERDRFGKRRLRVDSAETRLLALLSIAYGRVVSPSVLDHIRKASRQWSRGEDCLAASWIDQAKRQVAASGGRPIEWHFAERGAAEYARKLFENNCDLARIRVVYTPWSEDTE